MSSASFSHRANGLVEIAPHYKGILSDVWGVVHNGQSVYQSSVDALAAYREQGGHVVLITNSPRPKEGVRQQLKDMGVRDDCYDDIATSGDVTRVLISKAEGPIFHLGPDRDLPLFDGLDVEMCDGAEAETIVCTGLIDDEKETPQDYTHILSAYVRRGVPFICANPDLVVERGDRLIWCAGALARLYEQLGGVTRVAGKPHKPIYDLAFEKLQAVAGKSTSKSDAIAIGDGMPTDVAGAQSNGYDLLYISAGIHSGEYGNPDAPDEAKLYEFLDNNGAKPKFWMPRLSWEGV